MKESEKIWWLKIVVGLGLSTLSIFLQVYLNMEGMTIFLFGTIIYLGISDLISNMMKVERQRGMRIGVGAFIFTWLTSWTFIYTVIQTIS